MRRATPHMFPTSPRCGAERGVSRRFVWCALLCAPFVSVGCGEDHATEGAAARTTTSSVATTPPLERSAFDDAVRAIETYIGANRTREAEIVARRLVASAEGDASLAPTAHEYAARAYFARAELADDLAPDARAALLREAATEAKRAVEPVAHAGAGATQPSIDARRFAAMLADRIGDRDEAQRLYDAALAAAPDDVATMLPAALSALARNPNDARIDDLAARHERLAPEAAWSSGLRAEIALARGDHAAALVAAERALTLDRDLLEMRLVLAKALRANGRARDAARLLSALAPNERAKAAIAQQFALALTESGETAQAADAWNAAIRAQPGDAYVRAEAALAFLRAGDEARAASELEALGALFGGAAQRARIDPILRELRGAAPSN